MRLVCRIITMSSPSSFQLLALTNDDVQPHHNRCHMRNQKLDVPESLCCGPHGATGYRRKNSSDRVEKWALTLVAILVPVLLTGCVGWTHPTKSSADFYRDRDECDYEAVRATANMPPGPAQASNQSDIRHLCLKMRGYQLKFRGSQ